MSDIATPGSSGLCSTKETLSTDELINNDNTMDNSGAPVLIKLLANKPLIWKAEDWLKLQKIRIKGSLIGSPANFPMQVSKNGLPMMLMPEEVTLILEKNLGIICSYKINRQFPPEKIRKEYSEFLENNKKEQVEYYKEICKEQVEERIDTIIEGKKRKLLAKKKKQNGEEENSELEINREALVESEIERKLAAATSSYLIQIPTASPFISEEDVEPIEWKYPETQKEKVKYKVYKDLYEKGYTLTPGVKFGGDFLAYPGEAWKFHAFFIILCLEYDEDVKISDLIKHARLGVFTRKNLVLGSVDEDGKVFYNTVSWPAKA